MRKSRIPGSRWFISCLLVVPLCTAITSHTVLAAPETFANTLFPNPVIPVGDTPGTLAAGDFNSDGRLDFAVPMRMPRMSRFSWDLVAGC